MLADPSSSSNSQNLNRRRLQLHIIGLLAKSLQKYHRNVLKGLCNQVLKYVTVRLVSMKIGKKIFKNQKITLFYFKLHLSKNITNEFFEKIEQIVKKLPIRLSGKIYSSYCVIL